MAIDRDTRNRPQQWEDEAPAEPRFRRVQQGVPPNGRVLPGMPLEMEDADDDDPPAKGGARFGGQRFGTPRKQWWRRSGTLGRTLLASAIVGGVTVAAASGYFLKSFLGTDSRFRIAGTGNISAAGLTEVSRAEFNPIFGEDIGRNIFFVPIAERRKQLEEIPWIERATVMRLLPDQIRVQVVERKPVAFVLQDGRTGLVDANGVLLNMPAALMAQHHYSFPVLTGIDARQSPEARKARMDLYMHLIAELDSDGQRISDQISQIDLSNQEDARVTMPQAGGDILAHFGEDHFMERYQRYKTHINGWRQQYPSLASVDLRYEQQVVLDMNDGATAATGAAAEAGSTAPGGKAEVQPVLAAAPEAGKKAAAKAKAGKAPLAKSAKARPAKAGLKPAAKATKLSPAHKTARQKAEETARDKKRADVKRANQTAERRRSAARMAALTDSGQ